MVFQGSPQSFAHSHRNWYLEAWRYGLSDALAIVYISCPYLPLSLQEPFLKKLARREKTQRLKVA